MAKTASASKAAQERTSGGPLRYPKPGPIGGRLIREVVTQLKGAGFELPISSHILIACSAGADSTALALLLVKYGRRVGRKDRTELLHVHHGWRGKESDQDARFVEELGRKHGVAAIVHHLASPQSLIARGESWEEVARRARQEIFQKEAVEKGAIVLTAHQADDVAETLLWRLLTGASQTHGAGIDVRHGVEVRPLLEIRKADLKAFLEEEHQEWREDITNHEGRFLRSRMRQELMPLIETLFPRAVEHLVALGVGARVRESKQAEGNVEKDGILPVLGAIFAAEGLKVRRPHWEAIKKQVKRAASSKDDGTEIHLPGQWRVLYNPKSKPRFWKIEAGD